MARKKAEKEQCVEKEVKKERKTRPKKEPKKKMTEQELKDWDDLYMYVKEILGYDQNQSLPNFLVMRLKGLLVSKFHENNSQKDMSNYSYKTILMTFKACSPAIKKGLTSNSFKDEQHKINYVLKIVEPKINDIYLRMKSVEKTAETVQTVEVQTSNSGASYVKKTRENHNKRLDSLW